MAGAGAREPYDDGPVRDRIVAGAAECFERFGLSRATINDIARAAGVSRQTVYNHFADKAEVVGAFMSREAHMVNARARERLDLTSDAPDLLVRAEIALLTAARENRYLAVFLAPDAVSLSEQVVENSARVAEAQHDYWDPILDLLVERGELDDTLDRDELVEWLTFTHLMLCVRRTTFGGSEEETAAYLREFMVPALVTA